VEGGESSRQGTSGKEFWQAIEEIEKSSKGLWRVF